MLDLLVIGAGLTGLSAAIHAAQAGLSVRVIAKGLGAQLWSGGSIDLLGYLPDQSPVQTPLAALTQLPADHPLRQIDEARIQSTLATAQGWLAEEGLAYIGTDDGSNLWLPTAMGAKRPTYLAPIAQAAARLDDPSPLLIVGFDRMRDFYPLLLADNLRRQGHAARAHTLPLSLITDRQDINTVILAQAFDDSAHVNAVANVLRHVVAPGERVAFPAILGQAKHPEIIASLQNALGVPIAEIPTLPPSVPGTRLHHALVRRLEALGGRVETNMTAVEFSAHAGNLAWVATATSARPLRHRAHAYLLATGGILGGGMNSDHKGECWETIFNLPLVKPQSRSQWFRPEFLDPSGHPIFQSGIQVNQGWQPVDAQGEVVYGNLWAAGNLLVHADTIRSHSREALALVTGAEAIQAILAQRQSNLSQIPSLKL